MRSEYSIAMPARACWIHCIAIIVSSLSTMVAAADLQLTDGRVFKHGKIVAIKDGEVDIVHAGGNATVKADLVSALDLLKANEKAKESALMQSRIQEKAQKQLDKALPDKQEKHADKYRHIDADIRVIQVIPGGIIASGVGCTGPVLVRVRERVVMVKGTGLDSHKMVPQKIADTERYRKNVALPDRFHIRCATAGLVDGQNLAMKIRRVGEFAYTSVLGAYSTVESYAVVVD